MCLQLDFCGVVCLVGIKRVQTEIEITGLSETQLQRHHEVHHYCLVMRLDSKPPKVLKLRLETNPFFHGDGCLRNFLLQTPKSWKLLPRLNQPTDRHQETHKGMWTYTLLDILYTPTPPYHQGNSRV